MSTMAEDDIIAALVPIHGIGRWTVEMMLMFRLGRADVLPVDDLGIRKGAQEVDRLEAMPTPKELAARSEEHTSELQSLMRISYAVFCLKKKNTTQNKANSDPLRENNQTSKDTNNKKITQHIYVEHI